MRLYKQLYLFVLVAADWLISVCLLSCRVSFPLANRYFPFLFPLADADSIGTAKLHGGKDTSVHGRDLSSAGRSEGCLHHRIAPALGPQRSVPEREGVHHLSVSVCTLILSLSVSGREGASLFAL